MMTTCDRMIDIECVLTDLWRDPDGGWSANGSWVKRVRITVPYDATDRQVSRRIKAALGIQGWRADAWSGAEWSWRYDGIGAYADIVD